MIEPVAAGGIAYLFLGESMTGLQLVGEGAGAGRHSLAQMAREHPRAVPAPSSSSSPGRGN